MVAVGEAGLNDAAVKPHARAMVSLAEIDGGEVLGSH